MRSMAPTTSPDSGAARSATPARVRSVNVGRARPSAAGSLRTTGIDKRPTDDPVHLRDPGPRRGGAGSGLVGDHVEDRRHHGGTDQAVYAVAGEELAHWAAVLGRGLPDGMFGENLTTEGLDVDGALVGEIWRVGDTVRLQVTGPRIPCATFAGHLGEAHWVRRFTERGRTGAYLRVLTDGPVQAGDPVVLESRPDHEVTVPTMFRALTTHRDLMPLLEPLGDLLGDEGRRAVAAWLARRGRAT